MEFSGTKEMTASGQREQNVPIKEQEVSAMTEVTVTSLANLKNEVRYGTDHTLITDEPSEAGGEDAGPDPYTLLLAALGSCISMTVTLYAKRKNWPLERVTVRVRQQRIHAEDCRECTHTTEGFVHRIERSVTLEGNLSEEQRTRLQEISHKCPVHKTLTSEIVISDIQDGTTN
jgi:putative redox protein